MSKRASKTEMVLLGRKEKVSDWENQEKELTCDLRPEKISNFIKE